MTDDKKKKKKKTKDTGKGKGKDLRPVGGINTVEFELAIEQIEKG